MNPETLLAMKEAAEKSIRGCEWFMPEKDASLPCSKLYCCVEMVHPNGGVAIQVTPYCVGDIPVAEFIVQCNPDRISALIAERDELAAEVERQAGEIERLKQFCDEFVFEESGGSEERAEVLRTFHGKSQYE